MGGTSGAVSSKSRRHSQGNQAGAQGSHHRWHRLGAECVGSSSEMTNLGCGCRVLTEQPALIYLLLLSLLSQCACCQEQLSHTATSPAPESPELPKRCFPAGAGHSPWGQSQPSQPGTQEGTHRTEATTKNGNASSHRASDRQWQTCAVPSRPHSFPSIPRPT